MAFNLLGMFQPQPDQLQTLLGEYYNPQQARMSWLGGTLQGLGAGLASGRPGAWAQGAIAGGNPAVEDYQRRALAMYGVKQRADETAYQHGRDAKADQHWQQTFDYNKGRDAKSDAWTNTQNQHTLEQWQREQDQQDAANRAWGNLSNMPQTGIPVQNYGIAKQLWDMGDHQGAIQMVMPQQPATLKPTSDMQEYALAVQQGYTGTFQQYLMDLKKAGSTQVNVNGGGSDKQIFDTVKEQSDAAKSAQRGLVSLGNAQQALPGAITGSMAEQRLALQKVGALLGVADTNSIVDTETFRSAIAPQVAAMLKATVGNTQISNADREFAEKAAAGYIQLDSNSINRLINIMQAANSEAIRGFNSTLDSVYPQGQGFDRERAVFGVPNVAKRYASPIGPGMQQAPTALPPPNQSQTSSGYDLGLDQIPEGTPVEGEDNNIYMKRNGKLWRQNGQSWEEVTQ